MIELVDRKTGSRRTFSVIDAHHHIGEDVDGNENVPVGKDGSYRFSKRLEEDLKDALSESTYRYRAPDEEIVDTFEVAESEKHPYGLIDQFVVFPMKDRFRDEGKITYSRSNENISQWVSSSDHEKRLFGFGRVDPEDLEDARYMIREFPSKYGLIGLKVHPDSERFMLDSNQVVQLYIDCARMNLPIIFHTSYVSDVKKIHDGVNRTISLLVENNMKSLIGQLNVIVGHFSYNDDEAFRYLSHPCLYGEMSTLTSPEEFIRSAMEKIAISEFRSKTLSGFRKDVREELEKDFCNIFHASLNWSSKLMLGTDYPFLPKDNTFELLKALLCSELSDELHPAMIQNILGKNLIDILPVETFVLNSLNGEGQGSDEVSKFERREDQVDYYIEIIGKMGIYTGPIERMKSSAEEHARKDEYPKALEEIEKGLTIAKKGYTLAKMLDKRDTESGRVDEALKKASESAKKGQYSKGIKILKK